MTKHLLASRRSQDADHDLPPEVWIELERRTPKAIMIPVVTDPSRPRDFPYYGPSPLTVS
jgi:hypothetical protein